MTDRQDRTKLLLGEGAGHLAQARVLVLGVGGVGGYVAEALARAGVGHLVLVDGDRVEATNCNRQLAALTSTLGRFKAEVVAERLREINSDGEFVARVEFLEGEGIPALLDEGFDYAVDAIDSVGPKVDFIQECRRRKLPLVSSMGAGGKVDPSLVTLGDISKTHGCALARTVRAKLRERGVEKGVRVVFSPEAVPKEAIRITPGSRPVVGTVSYLPAIFGLYAASEVIRQLKGKKIPEIC